MQIDRSPALARYFAYHWHLVGNLGLDLLVPPIARVIGIEPATKLMVMAIPPLTGLAMLWMAREAHGRIPPTALFALPLTYAWPFQLGFVNFELAQLLAFLVFAAWLRLGAGWWRIALLVPASWLIWISHEFGLAILMLSIFGAAFAQARGRLVGRVFAAGLAILPLLMPLLFMALHRSQSPRSNVTGDWFDFEMKAFWVGWMLRDRWAVADMGAVAVLLTLLYAGIRDRRLGIASLLAWPATGCFAAFLLLPRLMLGGAYVDMRMAPTTLILALLAIRPPNNSSRLARGLALGGLAFLIMRIGLSTVSFAERGREQVSDFAAIAHIPRGAAVLTLVRRPCLDIWSDLRRDHFGSIALLRRDAFSNDQWQIEDQQLLRIIYDVPVAYREDPSEFVLPHGCDDVGSKMPTAIAGFPRDRFDYVWAIGTPAAMIHAADLRLVWSNGGSALFRVVRPI